MKKNSQQVKEEMEAMYRKKGYNIPEKGQRFFDCKCGQLVVLEKDARMREIVNIDEGGRKKYNKIQLIICCKCKKEFFEDDIKAIHAVKKLFLKK